MRHLRIISQKIPKPQILGFIKPNPNPNPNRTFNSSPEQSNSKPPSEKVISIADEISALTLLEVADLTKLLGEKLAVKNMPMVFPMMPGMGFSLRGLGGGGGGGGGGAAVAEEKKEEKTAFDLKLESGFEPGVKIKIIKEVRSFTELGLKEAKELVEKAPAVLKTGVAKEEAEKIIEKMKAIGAKVVME